MFYLTQNMRNILRQKQKNSPKTAAPKIQTPSKTKNIDLKRSVADRTLSFMRFLKLFVLNAGPFMHVAKIGDVEITWLNLC
jgi:hypothetical protein